MKELKIIFIPGWGMEENIWDLVLPILKDILFNALIGVT